MKNNSPSVAASSLAQVKQVRNLVTIGLFIALGIILSFFTINLTPMLRINLKFLITGVVGMLFGPVAGAMYGAAADVLGYLIAPSGPYFVGFTVISIINGILTGYLFYQKELSWKRIILGRFLVVLVCQIILNTWCLSLLYSKFFFAMLPARITKSLVLLPLEIPLLYYTFQVINKIKKRM